MLKVWKLWQLQNSLANTLCYDILQAMEMGNNIKKSVNQKYRLLEMEMYGIFKTLLLLNKNRKNLI